MMTDEPRELKVVPDPGTPTMPSRRAALAELVEACRTAFPDPPETLGLAATFESWGITDSIARERFGAADVFELAAKASQRLQTQEGGGVLDTRPIPVLRVPWLLRAAAYLLPALFVVIALTDTAVGASGVVFSVVTCLGWGLSESLSRISYGAINRGSEGAVRRSSRRRCFLWVPSITLLSVAIALESGAAAAGLLIAAQLLYLLASLILLPLGLERRLLAWTLPAVLIGFTLAAAGEARLLWIPLAIAIVGEVAALMAGLHYLRRFPEEPHAAPNRQDFTEATPFLLSGMAMGALVLTATAVALTAVGARPAMIVLVLPLMASMGYAEMGIRRYREVLVRHLEGLQVPKDFERMARRSFNTSTFGFAAVLVSLELVATLLFEDRAGVIPAAALLLVVLLGVALYLTLVLMVMDHVLPIVGGFALAVLAVGANLVLADSTPVQHTWFAASVAAALAAYLFAAARSTVGIPARHGFS